MSEKIRIKISPTVAAFLQPTVTAGERIRGLTALAENPIDLVTLAFCLSKDVDQQVRNTAVTTLTTLPEHVLAEYIVSPGVHPAILDQIAIHCVGQIDRACQLLASPLLSESTRDFLLAESSRQWNDRGEEASSEVEDESSPPENLSVNAPEDTSDKSADAPNAEDPRYQNAYKQSRQMGIAQKIKMAITGDKEWRATLVKDSNKLVAISVMKNPRITEAEILTIIKAGIQNDEIMRLICTNKEWVKSYPIRKALVESPRTPIQYSLRFLTSLTEKDISGYAKSKNISTVISTQARRIMLNKKRP